MPEPTINDLTFERDHEGDADYGSWRDDDVRVYKVYLGGKLIGHVDRSRQTSSTTYRGTRIRRDLGRPVCWSWTRAPRPGEHKVRQGLPRHLYDELQRTASNSPGLYGRTRKEAAAELLRGHLNAPKVIRRARAYKRANA